MKKTLLISSVIIGLSLTSCSKDPEDILPRKDGKWSFTGTIISVPVSGSFVFNNDYTYTETLRTPFGQVVGTGKWSATETTVTLIDNTENDKEYTTVFNVSDKKRSSETWTYTDSDASTATLKLIKD